MKSYIHLISFLCLLSISHASNAAINCTTPISTGFSTGFNATSVFPNVTQASVSFTCTRSSPSDATTVYLRANNGSNRQGRQNRAAGGFFNFFRINYELYKDASCSTVWSNGNQSTIPVTLSAVTTPQPITINYWGCILSAPSVPAGTYTDSVRIRVRATTNGGGSGNNLSPNGTANVSIITPASCSITSVDNINFGTYQALQATPLVSPVANIVMNCTTDLPYTMSLNSNTGVISGLHYSLSINGSPPPVSATGAGVGQVHSLVGTMPANQAGTCTTASCTGTQVHTLTVTY